MTTAWHFVADALRDGRPLPPDGEWLEHEGPCRMCGSGLHASRRVIDALGYAPGDTICRVEVAEIADEDNDKLVARRRRILWRVDGEDLLRDFARRCALDVIHLWNAPLVVVEYLKTGDPELWGASWGAARAAAWAASWGAARDAAWAASWGAARDAAGAAARDAARAASWDAARDTQNRRLAAMVSAAHKKEIA